MNREMRDRDHGIENVWMVRGKPQSERAIPRVPHTGHRPLVSDGTRKAVYQNYSFTHGHLLKVIGLILLYFNLRS